jgi:hypothetical protein
MKTLVIHPKDSSTDFLSVIYTGRDWTIINTNVTKEVLEEQIKNHDRIIMLGHGTENGLIGFNKFIINSSLVYLLREKNCIFIWCKADVFVERHNLHGFYTGMIISEYKETIMCNVPTNSYWISESNTDFATAIKESIDDTNMLEKAKMLYEGNTAVVEFNRNRLYYR